MELHAHLCAGNRHILATTDIDGNSLPAPVVDEDTHSGKGLGRAVRCNSGFLKVSLELSADDIVGRDRADGTEELHLFVTDALHVRPVGGLHAEEADHLHEVVFDHIAEAPCGIIKGTATIHTEGLGHGDLDITDVVAVPDRLQEGIGKAGVEDILRCLLSKVVVDAEDLTLLKDIMQGLVESLGGGLVVAEGFLYHNAGVVVDAIGSLEPLGHSSEQDGRNRQIMDGPLGASESLLQRFKGGGIRVVPVHILELVCKFLEDLLIHTAPVSGDSFTRAVDDLLSGHAALGDADDRPLKHTPAVKRLDGVEEFLMGQVSGRSEEDQGVAFEQ